MSGGLVEGGIDPTGLDNILSAARRPRNLLRSLRGINVDGMTVNEELIPVRFCGAVEPPVYRVVLQHVCHILSINEWVIDANDLGFEIVQGGTKHQPPDPA